jgi:hypothetical protein
MIDSLTSLNYKDFTQRYSGTIGFFLTDKEKRVVSIDNVDSRRARFSDENKNEYHVDANGGGVFEFIQVQRGWFNALKDTYFLQRIPARQWQRGICRANTASYVLKDTNFSPTDLTVKLISKLFPSKVTVADAMVDYLAGERLGLALSKHFAINKAYLLMHDHTIGTVQLQKGTTTASSKLIIQSLNPMFHQEITDVINRNRFNGVIEIGN